ncbi:MAG TPA: hypothetical protein PLP29_06190 [Candidatus Ozemobacteraceae bacterium]|mgnify:CR=1 FL=1|nr:hypothetical protein [Candidatus Ozemobacteraceae bacterium]
MPHSAGLIRGACIACAISFIILSLAGCGGGGGGNPVGTAPSLPDTPLVPLTTAQLSAAGKSVESSFTQGALALGLPTATRNEKYAVLLVNGGAATTIKVNGGGSPGLADIRASEAAIQPASRPLCGTPFLKKARKLSQRGSIRANIAASVKPLTTTEQLGQTVPFRIYSGGTLEFPTYSSRTGVLRRIGTYCKLFVDPVEYGGLSAVAGAYAITDAQLDEMVDNFDKKIYPLMTVGYGPSYDLDGDGKVAVFLSPLVTRKRYAGFFDPENFTTSSDSNQRDMFCMWTPDASWKDEAWLDATCETIAHEFQHLINYSDRLKKVNYRMGSVVDEEVWLDEALSMGAEIRYRLLVGDLAGEGRYNDYVSYISKTQLTIFSNELWEYGCVGLFAHYLYEQGGADRIRSLVTSGLQGAANINAAFANHSNSQLRSFSDIQANWKKTVFAELNRNRLAGEAWSAIPAHQKYTADFDIAVTSATHSFGGGFQGSISAGAMSMFVIGPPAGYTADSSALYMQAVDVSGQQTGASIACTVLRLND